MSLITRPLAEGAGWRMSDNLCQAGPSDPVFEEQHQSVCMAIVMHGTFDYRCSSGKAAMAPGSILVGAPGEHFECGHAHSTGDRCLSFHVDLAAYEAIVEPVAKRPIGRQSIPAIFPARDRFRLLSAADAASEGTPFSEELLHRLALTVAMAPTRQPLSTSISRRTRRIVRELAREIECFPNAPYSLSSMAATSNLGTYHILRAFRSEFGITPHQFVLSQRIRVAASLLRKDEMDITEVALAAGFDDLSGFIRYFRRIEGCSPLQYRNRH